MKCKSPHKLYSLQRSSSIFFLGFSIVVGSGREHFERKGKKKIYSWTILATKKKKSPILQENPQNPPILFGRQGSCLTVVHLLHELSQKRGGREGEGKKGTKKKKKKTHNRFKT